MLFRTNQTELLESNSKQNINNVMVTEWQPMVSYCLNSLDQTTFAFNYIDSPHVLKGLFSYIIDRIKVMGGGFFLLNPI
ncbi:MAG: hypothetical protein ACOCQR_01475 [bacterium]